MKRDSSKPEINNERFSFAGYWLKTNSYNYYGYLKALRFFLSLAKIHKAFLENNHSEIRKKLLKKSLANARKMAFLYLNCVECPHGISYNGLTKVKIH